MAWVPVLLLAIGQEVLKHRPFCQQLNKVITALPFPTRKCLRFLLSSSFCVAFHPTLSFRMAHLLYHYLYLFFFAVESFSLRTLFSCPTVNLVAFIIAAQSPLIMALCSPAWHTVSVAFFTCSASLLDDVAYLSIVSRVLDLGGISPAPSLHRFGGSWYVWPKGCCSQ
jgi:hypothetical protein